ncbi:MAG: aldo/keto reductase [Thermoplasmata archaeon]
MTLDRRAWSRTGLVTSVLGWALTDSDVLPRPVLHSTLERARDAGIDLFDLTGVSGGSPIEQEIEQILAEEVPGATVVSGRSMEGISRGPNRAAGLESALAASLSDEVGSAQLTRLIEWRSDGDGDHDERAVEALKKLTTAQRIRGWGWRLAGRTSEAPEGASFVSGPLSLIEPALLHRPGVELIPFLARDPFAGGHLDGTRFDQATSPLVRRTAPMPLREIQRDLADVIALAPLASGRGRTLAQAALRWVVDAREVTAVLAPLPPPERLQELLAFPSVPPLSPAEQELVLRTRTRP